MTAGMFMFMFPYTTVPYLTCFLCCRGKTNFFEKRVGEYQKASVMANLNGDSASGRIFSTEEDF